MQQRKSIISLPRFSLRALFVATTAIAIATSAVGGIVAFLHFLRAESTIAVAKQVDVFSVEFVNGYAHDVVQRARADGNELGAKAAAMQLLASVDAAERMAGAAILGEVANADSEVAAALLTACDDRSDNVRVLAERSLVRQASRNSVVEDALKQIAASPDHGLDKLAARVLESRGAKIEE